MIVPPRVLNSGQPTAINGGGGTVTLVEASTFCLSDHLGDIHSGTSQGLFFRDARVISRWELRLDGQPAEHLTVLTPEAFKARFILRKPPRPGVADSTVLVVRRRLIGDGMRETITVHNLGHEDTAMTITLFTDADFADLFAVKEGRNHVGSAEQVAADGELHLTDHAEPGRGLTISATAGPVMLPGTVNWQVVVPAHGRWHTEILAQPVLSHRRVQMAFGDDEDSPISRLKAWRATATDLTATDPNLTEVLQRTESDLGALRIDGRDNDSPAYVAAGAPWFMTLFGRDSLLTSWMALPLDSALAVGTLRQLAKLQGKTVNPITEEEPGRIMHEMRHGPASGAVLGGTVYYGSVDATPLFVMLLAECWRWGADESVIKELLPAADAALAWIDEYGDADGDGFVEYRRKTDRGLTNQGWKDSFDAINDSSGHLAEPSIALCEVQGYVYAARLARAELADHFGDTETANTLRAQAEDLKSRFDEAFWVQKNGWYAVALDGQKNQVDALTSNAAQCLWTGIVGEDRAAELVDRLADPSMDSGFGLRTLASTMGAFNPMSYHNGSVWPHDTAIAVAGLLRYRHVPGAGELAERLATGLLDAATDFGGRLPELFCGFARTDFRSPIPYPTSCSPQAWASAAPLLLVRSFLGLNPCVPGRVLKVTPHLPREWGKLVLTDLRLGRATVSIQAEGSTMHVHGLPEDWELVTD
ncbi:amylo-alpha-1,6-glucosidase [Nocardia donostiensis]|uniref:Amylo-alpha-1,6-glucosidase n=1 Tax=Nocardia donostiensis TaxID=1538463 RepID=A0A1W0BMK8_9NOCA|nr:glycogen debranching N-terminal domain-containing protein [Nocardia donostiensis]ONM50349.1 amylo-alpha-1,6-glucosidase [Nocardia donostiensis]OQS16012.1 amylo-alpha-1,6-glucosidase [Nocardia donostiensis]OQS23744.1 amylo-alpha-1,6-glucosidase [Nocardia donostiensis]